MSTTNALMLNLNRPIALLGYSQNMISMVLDNLFSIGYSHELFVINNEFKSIDNLTEIQHPNIPVVIKNIDSISTILNEFENIDFFMGVYKSQSKIQMHQQFNAILENSPNIVHGNTDISKTTRLGIGNMINTGVLIAGHTKIGNYCCINRGSTIGHHTKIGDFCTINPNVTICGAIDLGSNVTIGASATVIDGLKIGSNSIIGAGSVVVSDIPANSLALGVPAKVIRELYQ